MFQAAAEGETGLKHFQIGYSDDEDEPFLTDECCWQHLEIGGSEGKYILGM